MEISHIGESNKNSELGRTRATENSVAKSLAPDNTGNRNEGEPRVRTGLQDVELRVGNRGVIRRNWMS